MDNENFLLCSVLILVLNITNSFGDVTGRDGYLIDTAECRIPKFSLNFTVDNALPTCGVRYVHVRKVTDEKIEFQTYLKNCCYLFISRTKEPCKLKKSTCKPFKSGSLVFLETEFLEVKCDKSYTDYFAFVKRKPSNPSHENSFNVLMVGMDSMSRTRALSQMPATVEFFRKTKWLDFKGYNKVSDESYSKLSFLSNKDIPTLMKECVRSLSHCNKLLVWKEFENAGYVTAYGEDAVDLPQTTNFRFYFTVPPTNHYLKPLFMAGEKEENYTFCTPQISSASQMLKYAYDFLKTYKKRKFFGFFWLNSFSHSSKLEYSPQNIDENIADFFKGIIDLGLYKNTFVIFFSNHGLLYGPSKTSVESYYEERLPMFYMRVPTIFQRTFTAKYINLKGNQNRLITPYDLHLTLRELSTNITEASAFVGRHASCPRCRSLFKAISSKRTCSDAGIHEKWCTCHEMKRVRGIGTRKFQDYSAYYSLVQSVISLNNKTKSIITKKSLSPCPDLTLKKVVRLHYYQDIRVFHEFKTYYVIAMMMEPDDVIFEAIVRKDENRNYEVLQPLETLTDFTRKLVCTMNPMDMKYCVCEEAMKKCLLSRKKIKPKAKCPFQS